MRDTLFRALLTDEAGEVDVSFAMAAVIISVFAVIAFSSFGMSAAELIEKVTSVIESTG
jgi:Flp pilus assembly pilin Flp